MEEEAIMEDETTSSQSFSSNSDICQQLLTRYAHSSAAQHRHLCATAAATRSIIQSSSLPLNPFSYFAATITSLSNSHSLDSTALAALTSFLSIVLPLVGRGEVSADKAGEAVGILVSVVEGSNLGTSGVRALVKCVGILVAEFCDSSDWDSVGAGFEWLVKYSLDKRPKVRKCAQDCLLTVLKSLGSSSVSSKASKFIYSLFKDHIPFAMEITASTKTKNEAISKPEHQEVLHLLNVLKHVAPYLSLKSRERILLQLLKILSSQFSALTRHIFDLISVIFETSGSEFIVSNAEGIFKSLVSYISLLEENPVDTVLFAVTLAKTALGKLHDVDTNEWTTYFPLVTESLAGLLASKAEIASQSSSIFRELIDRHIDRNNFLFIGSQGVEDEATHHAEVKALETTCNALYKLLDTSSQIPNEHILSVVAFLFLKLGDMSHIFMKGIILKLAEFINVTSNGVSEIKHLQNCIGSVVAAIGPEKLLELLPISFCSDDYSCSNTWLIPILEKNVVGSSLQFFMEHIVPLAESFEQASRKVKKSVIRRDLQAYARGCWGLLPAFCRRPTDTYQCFAAVARLLLPFLKKDSFMLENIAIGLRDLVNQIRGAAPSNFRAVGLMDVQRKGTSGDVAVDLEPEIVYPSKTLGKDTKALALCSKELLQALTNVFLESPPETRKYLKDAIQCLACICDSSITKEIFFSALEKTQLLDDSGEYGKVDPEPNSSGAEEESISVPDGGNAKRSLVLELASCIVEGSDVDLVNILFCVSKRALQATDEMIHIDACKTLSIILEKHSWFCSSQFDVVMDLLTGLKSSTNIALLTSRFACLQALLIHAITTDMDEENTKSFLVLNEIILALKDSNEEGRKAAYDALNGISSKLRCSLDKQSDDSYRKLLTMITGYLSGSSPHIKSGVVSALSVLTYSDHSICLMMPDMVPSVMELLHSKTIEVIKAVLGFVKVLVSCLVPNDLQNFLSEIMDGILRWSSISRHHFKTKVTVILEIMIRKCGSAKVRALAPEKYKDYVHDVVMNRRGKTNSRETGSGEAKPEPSESSLIGQQKRKRYEGAILPKEEGSTRPWKRKHDMKHNAVKFPERDHGNQPSGNSNKRGGSNVRDFKGYSSGEKKRKARTVMDKEGKIHRPAIASKSPKHKKVGKKGQKIS